MAKKKIIIIPYEDTAKWLCTFNDLMTLLLTFFVLLLSMSSLDSKSIKDIQENLINALGVLEEGQFQEETIIEKIFRIDEIGKKMKLFKNILPPMDEGIEQPDRIEDITPPRDLLEDFIIIKEEGIRVEETEEFIFNQFREIINENFNEPGITILKKERGVLLRLENSILFTPGGSNLQEKALPLLDKVVTVASQTGFDITVEGHTDSTPIRTREFPSNWELSVSRAVSVVMYMVETAPALARKISVSGLADTRPAVPNDTPQNRARNRRIEILLSRE